MREFRAKNCDMGCSKWVYGSLIEIEGANPVIVNKDVEDVTVNKNKLNNLTVSHVIGFTLGQYTGLKDVKGTKIFEGDICNVDGDIYEVYWRVTQCDWGLMLREIIKNSYHNCFSTSPRAFNDYPKMVFQVIGNIHDKEDSNEQRSQR